MAGSETTSLKLTTRGVYGLARGPAPAPHRPVPGVVYGGDGAPEPVAADARVLRNTLAHAHAVLEISVDGGATSPVIVKDVQRHPVRGELVLIDLLRVRMDVAIQLTVALELTGGDEAPGVAEGGILNQETRELNIEALPGTSPTSCATTSPAWR